MSACGADATIDLAVAAVARRRRRVQLSLAGGWTHQATHYAPPQPSGNCPGCRVVPDGRRCTRRHHRVGRVRNSRLYCQVEQTEPSRQGNVGPPTPSRPQRHDRDRQLRRDLHVRRPRARIIPHDNNHNLQPLGLDIGQPLRISNPGHRMRQGGPSSRQPVGGTAIIDVQPFAMVATSQVQGFGTIVLRDNGTDVWEEGGGNYGLSPGSATSGSGSSLTGFASLVEGTLGPRQGALAMLGLASPTGYLNLDPAETSSASLVGTGTVSGTPVDVYQIFQTPGQVAQVPGLTAQEQLAVADAMKVLHNQGYTGSTVRISVDAAGFIRRTQTTDHFADGTIMASEAEFSNFGCAGTVLMPGQSGSATPPAGCTSPDNPTSTAAPTTTVPASGSTTTFPSPTTTPPTGSAPVAPPSTTTSTTSSTLPSTSTSLPSGPTTTVPSAPPSSAP